MPLRIGQLSTFYHTSMLLMTRGDLEDFIGLPVQWQLYGTGPSIIEAFSRDEIDLAYIGLPPVIIGIANGIKIRCVAGGHIEGTVLASNADAKAYPETRDIKNILLQFSGYSIGVPGRGSIHDVIMSELLDRFNLKERIKVVNFKWADQALEAFVKGDVIAVAGTPALAVAVKRFGNGKVLYPPSLLWPYNPSYGIVVSETLLKDGRHIIERFLLLHEDAAAVLRDRPDEAADVISRFVGIVDRDFVKETIILSPRYCSQLTYEYIKVTMEFVKAMKRLGYIGRSITRDEIFETDIIMSIHGSGDHY